MMSLKLTTLQPFDGLLSSDVGRHSVDATTLHHAVSGTFLIIDINIWTNKAT